jgi:hypothetical protein
MQEKIIIANNQVVASIPEGVQATAPLEDFIRQLAPDRLDTGTIILPDGVKSLRAAGPFVVMVHQTPPRVFRFKWVSETSRAKYGSEAEYRTVRIAQPYIIILAVFCRKGGGKLQLTGYNECFYRVKPLESLDDRLSYPALLNCSKFAKEKGHPLSWICSQFLNKRKLAAIPDLNRRIHASFRALFHLFFESGFNYSSEHHEESSWFSESQHVDKRIASVEAWEQATKKDPLFVLDVPWLDTGRTVQEVINHIFENHNVPLHVTPSQKTLTSLVFNSEKNVAAAGTKTGLPL